MPGHLVRRDRHAEAGAADQQRAVGLPGRDELGRRDRDLRIGVVLVGADTHVGDRLDQRAGGQVALERLFVVEACVVGPDDDAEFLHVRFLLWLVSKLPMSALDTARSASAQRDRTGIRCAVALFGEWAGPADLRRQLGGGLCGVLGNAGGVRHGRAETLTVGRGFMHCVAGRCQHVDKGLVAELGLANAWMLRSAAPTPSLMVVVSGLSSSPNRRGDGAQANSPQCA